MHKAIQIRKDYRRGCGFRKVGNYYLISGVISAQCGKLPIPLLGACPCCGRVYYDLKRSRAATWIPEPWRIWADMECKPEPDAEFVPCDHPNETGGTRCALANGKDIGPAGLIWIGEKFYRTPEAWVAETRRTGPSGEAMGVSRAIPPHFAEKMTLGQTWILVAHANVLLEEPEFGKPENRGPAIFQVFKPTAVEVVVTPETSDSYIDQLVKKGFTPIIVERVPDPAPTNGHLQEEAI